MTQWSILDTWIVIVGSLCAAACALPGTLLVLRKMSMMGDAISHTVLAGLAIAFLVTHRRDPATMFVGAVVIGLVTALLIQLVGSLGRTEIGASMGIVFTSLFAMGLVLMRQAIDHVEIDPDCVLYGAIEASYFDQITWMGMNLPRAAIINGGAGIFNLLLIVVLYKEFKVSAFDPALSTTLGINANVMHYLLMTMTAVTTVAAFETVGSILVIAMLIVPPATAYLLTDRLSFMMCWSVLLAILAAIFGHVSAVTVPTWFGFGGTSTAGMMAFCAGLIFVAVWLLAPRHGVLSKVFHRCILQLRIVREDVLGLLYRLEELPSSHELSATPALLQGILGVGPVVSTLAVSSLTRRGYIEHRSGQLHLTNQGRRAGRHLIRSHRLWESFLQKHLHLASDHVHEPAEQLEHITDAAMQNQLAERTNQPQTDPHGKKIP